MSASLTTDGVNSHGHFFVVVIFYSLVHRVFKVLFIPIYDKKRKRQKLNIFDHFGKEI